MKLRQLTLALSLVGASSIGLVGCGGSSNNYDEVGEVTLSGTAAKGVLSSATVVACLATAESCTTDNAFGTTQTGSDGTYSINLGEVTDNSPFANQPVLVRIFADTDTTHQCDFSACEVSGQNDVSGLELTTVSFIETPDGDASLQADVNVLSTIATESLLDVFDAGDISSVNQFEAATTSASNAVASLLGLDLSVTVGTETQTVNLFDVSIPSAVPSELGDVAAQGDIPAALVQQLSVVNASFGATVDGDTTIADAISEVSTVVSNIVADAADGEDADSGDVSDLTTIVTAINTEVTSIASDVADEVDGFEEPDVVDAGDVEDNAGNLDVDTDLGGDGDGGTQPSGGSGGSGGSGVS